MSFLDKGSFFSYDQHAQITSMKKEKIVLSFIAVLIGILVAGVAFYFYQGTKTIPDESTLTKNALSPTPTQKPSIFLSVDTPEDGTVSEVKTIKISGKTIPEAIVVISTETNDQVITPASNGNFSTNATIGNDQNILVITAIAPNGEEASITRTVTFSTENF